MARFHFLKNPRFLGTILLAIALSLFSFWVIKEVQRGKVLGETTVAAEGSCTPIKEMSGATTPNFDCREGGSANVTLKACLPEGCPLDGAAVEFEKTLAECPGREWAGCGGACGATATKATLTIPAGQHCAFETISCSPPRSCGSCQVDIDGYGIRRWQKFGCPAPTVTPTPEPTVALTPTPTSTPTPTATATPMPTATNTPGPAAASTPEPTATPQPQVLGVSEILILPKTGFEGESWLKIGLLGVALSVLSILI
jgi:hypothetical protein